MIYHSPSTGLSTFLLASLPRVTETPLRMIKSKKTDSTRPYPGSWQGRPKMLKELDSLGTIEVGKYADMILLDRNPLDSIKNTLTINRVIKNGRIQERIN